MAKYILEMFAVSLLLTLLLEFPVAWVFGLRKKKELLLVLLANILTNPAAVTLHWLGIPQIPLELAVVLTEASIYCLFSKDSRWNIPHPASFALCANLFSWTIGLLIQ